MSEVLETVRADLGRDTDLSKCDERILSKVADQGSLSEEEIVSEIDDFKSYTLRSRIVSLESIGVLENGEGVYELPEKYSSSFSVQEDLEQGISELESFRACYLENPDHYVPTFRSLEELGSGIYSSQQISETAEEHGSVNAQVVGSVLGSWNRVDPTSLERISVSGRVNCEGSRGWEVNKDSSYWLEVRTYLDER